MRRMSEFKLKPLLTWRGAIAGSDLESTTRLVAWGLSLHMSERGDSCFPSVNTIARETALDPRTVQRHLRLLRDAGWLAIKAGGGRGKSNTYEARIPPETTAEEQGLSVGDSSNGGVGAGKGGAEYEEPRHSATRVVQEDVQEDEKTAPSSALALVEPLNGARKHDELFDALVEALDVNPAELTDSHRGALNKSLRELRKVGATPTEVLLRAAAYLDRFPGVALTAPALAKHWAALGKPQQHRTPKPKSFGVLAAVASETGR